MKAAFERADSEHYRFGSRKPKSTKNKYKNAAESTPIARPGTILIPGIMHERNISCLIADIADDSDGGDKIISDDGSDYSLDDCAFSEGGSSDRESDGEDEMNVMGPGWKWDQWQDIGPNDEVPGPPISDPYNGPHGLLPGVTKSFTTILQCIFVCTAMDEAFFKRLAANSNKYARAEMAKRTSNLFIGRKWINIGWG